MPFEKHGLQGVPMEQKEGDELGDGNGAWLASPVTGGLRRSGCGGEP
jgi:hypothetical protein